MYTTATTSMGVLTDTTSKKKKPERKKNSVPINNNFFFPWQRLALHQFRASTALGCRRSIGQGTYYYLRQPRLCVKQSG
jgi:hypothetical protein